MERGVLSNGLEQQVSKCGSRTLRGPTSHTFRGSMRSILLHNNNNKALFALCVLMSV